MGATTSTTATPTIIFGTAAPKNNNMPIVDLNAQTGWQSNFMILKQLQFKIGLSGVKNVALSTLHSQLVLLLVNWVNAIPNIGINQYYDIYMQLYMAIVIVETDLKISLNNSAILSPVCAQAFASSPQIFYQLKYAFLYLENNPFVYNGDLQYNTVRAGMIDIVSSISAPISSGTSGAGVYVEIIHRAP